MTADDKKKFDEMITKMVEMKTKKMGELKSAADYS